MDELRVACEEALQQKTDDPDPVLLRRCDQEFPEMVDEQICREYVAREFSREGWEALDDSGVDGCIEQFPNLKDEIFQGDDPCDQNGPLAESCSCEDVLDHPDWEWLNRAIGLQYQCGRAECWLQFYTRDGQCGVECDPAFGAILSSGDISHVGDNNIHFVDSFDGYEVDCTPM